MTPGSLMKARTPDGLLECIANGPASGLGRSMLLSCVHKADLDPMLDRLIAAGLVEARRLPRKYGKPATVYHAVGVEGRPR